MKRILALCAALVLLVAAAVPPAVLASPGLSFSFTLQNAATGNGNGTAADVAGLGSLYVQVTGLGTATIAFATSADGGSTYVGQQCLNVTSYALAATTSTNGNFLCGIAGSTNFIAQISGYSSGTITVKATGITGAVVPAGGAPSGSSYTETQNCGAATSGGKQTAGTLRSVWVANTSGATVYLDLFDQASGSVSLSAGSTANMLTAPLTIANTGAAGQTYANGLNFANALSIACVTGFLGTTTAGSGVTVWAVYD